MATSTNSMELGILTKLLKFKLTNGTELMEIPTLKVGFNGRLTEALPNAHSSDALPSQLAWYSFRMTSFLSSVIR